jgi:nitroreductase
MSGQRLTLLLLFMIVAVSTRVVHSDTVRALPKPRLKQIPVLAAIGKRQSDRDLSRRELPEQVLSELLWAAYGINRPGSGKRTAPSSHNEQEIDVYAVMQQGTFLYDARKHGLIRITTKDLRALTGRQKFPANAPLNLVYVLDYSRTPNSGERAREVGAVAVGAIAQNVYLYCAGTGLATVFRGWIDKDKLAGAMQLSADQYIVGAQTVGYPAGK